MPERQYKKLDQDKMSWATTWAKERIDNYLRIASCFKEDPKKTTRTLASQCLSCFYSDSRIGGCAMTNQPCGLCKKDQLYGSTSTDVLCMDCAVKNSLCKHCGADFELREKRRKWPKAED